MTPTAAATEVVAEIDRRRRLGRRARLLALTSVAYNTVEAVVALTAGAVSGSVALIGFGLDSVVETSSGLVILWQFGHTVPASRERRAMRLIGGSFLALAAYVSVDSVVSLLTGHTASPSPVGIGLALASLVVMPALSRAQRRTGQALGSGSVVADSRQTMLCSWLSAVLLAGLVANAAFGVAWLDPVAGLVIAGVAAKEGVDAWRGDTCCP